MSFFKKLSSNTDILLAFGVIGILVVMVLPMPPFALDFFISIAIASAVVLLLTSVYASKALEFSLFPTLLLVLTLFRLSINVATTRAVLLHGADEGLGAAGHLIQTFGEFVVGGNYAVGIIVFTILVIINFIVITKGASRVAEVAARFTLDAMPGKQMAIDADLNAGMINEEEARRRRSEIAREADFYGAMDGASKFVRGDAIAGILIVIVNIVGGILIGTFQKGLDIGRAVEVFTLLTIGDGLVTQIPALIVSTAAGIIVTRTASGSNLGQEFTKQLFTHYKPLAAASLVMLIMGVLLGTFALIAVSAGLGYIAYSLYQKENKALLQKSKDEEKERLKPKNDKIENLLTIDALELEVGYGLISLVDAAQNGDLLERVTNIRKQFALDLGIVVPPLRIRDNLELKPGDYRILLKGIMIGQGTLMVGHNLAMDPGNITDKISGIPTKEPAFGLDALWIPESQKEDATYAGYTVVDLSTVVATHLTELIRSHAHELLGRQELQTLLDALKQTAPKVIEDLVPNILAVSGILKVLKSLLKEGVTIRDLKTILETLSEYGAITKDTQVLTEYVRSALSRSILKKLVDPTGEIPLLTLDKEIEETLAQSVIHTDQGQQLSVDPEFVRKFIAELNQKASEMMAQTGNTVVLCSPAIRRHLKDLVDRFIPNITVLSHNEIAPQTNVRSIGTVRWSHAS